MKHVFYALISLSLLMLQACSSAGKSETDAPMLVADSIVASAPQRMQESDIKADFSFKGREYRSTVVRRPDESLPLVTNEQGEQFVDNRITLRLVAGDKTIVNRAFTKTDFASLVNAKFMRYALLEGLVFDQTTPAGIVYAASVAYPQSDLYVPIRIVISADGHLSMSCEETLDGYHAPTDTVRRK